MHAWTDPLICHKDMADVFENFGVVSAGFVVTKNGILECVGESLSLGKKSRYTDTVMLQAAINISTRESENE